MELAMIKRMICEVTDETLAGLLTETVAKFDLLDVEQLRTIDAIVCELKRRHGIIDEVVTKNKPKGKRDYAAERQRKQSKEAGGNGGSVREESDKLQSGESGATGTTRMGNEAK